MEQNKEIEIYQYAVSLATQMGIKYGELLLSVIGNRINGMLDILGERQGCTGERNSDGSCTLFGQLKTKRSVFDYTARGHFDKESILLDLKYKHGVFRLTGRKMVKNDPANLRGNFGC